MDEIRNINIVSIFRNAGIDVKKHGTHWKATCPFHDDTEPSLVLYESNTYHCFGCGEHGDAAGFLMKYHNLTFPEALKELNIQPSLARVRDNAYKKQLVDDFNDWQHKARWTFTKLLYSCDRLCKAVKNEKDLDIYGDVYNLKTTWEYYIDILYGQDKEAKLELYKYLKGYELFEVECGPSLQAYERYSPKEIIGAWVNNYA